ncbi:MAG: UxaA family hydrolase [Mesorhizobium sp.]
MTEPDQEHVSIALWDAVRIAESDQVAVAARDLEGAVSVLAGEGRLQVILPAPIPSGHKFALFDMPIGTEIRKYGHVIGVLTKAVATGEHVHIHNLVSRRAKAR